MDAKFEGIIVAVEHALSEAEHNVFDSGVIVAYFNAALRQFSVDDTLENKHMILTAARERLDRATRHRALIIECLSLGLYEMEDGRIRKSICERENLDTRDKMMGLGYTVRLLTDIVAALGTRMD